jgi:hypothetical protein
MSAMPGSLLSREVVPFLLVLVALAAAALALDAVLHLLDAVWIGKYLGIPGVLLILASFGYSLRKRRLIGAGNLPVLLRMHQRLAWTGALMVLVHAGIHFNAILAWLAVWAMLINVGSGLVGKFLLRRSRRRLDAISHRLQAQGLSAAALEDRLHWDSLTFDVVRQWHVVHVPIALAFAVLSVAHIVSALLFWSWR